MKLYEAQIKDLMMENKLPLPYGQIFDTKSIIKKNDIKEYVVKAQVLTGKRYHNGGIVFASNENLKYCVDKMLKSKIKNSNEFPVCGVYVEEKIDFTKEIYFSITMKSEGLFLIVGKIGGVDIEENKDGTNFLKFFIGNSWKDSYSKSILDFLELKIDNISVFQQIYNFFKKYDLTFLEINPLALTNKNKFIILDAKSTIDEKAFFRQKDAIKVFEKHKYDERFYNFNQLNDNFIDLEGNIACVVNGAGLAMATIDAISANGGRAANFLDLGGGVTTEQINTLLNKKIFSSTVKVVLFNIFGGIVNCQKVAQAIIKSINDLPKKPTLVVRMEGNGSREAKKILSSFPNIIIANSFSDVVKKAILERDKE